MGSVRKMGTNFLAGPVAIGQEANNFKPKELIQICYKVFYKEVGEILAHLYLWKGGRCHILGMLKVRLHGALSNLT